MLYGAISRFTIIGWFILLLATFWSGSNQALAQAQGAGIGLRPATIEDRAEPGDVKQYSIAVTNLSGTSQTYYLFTRDIVGVEAGGVPIFADEDAEKTGYELTEWVDLSVGEVTVAPGEEASFDVTINVPENATPGSHFGGIFTSVEPPRLRSTGASVGYEVASIVSIRVAGDVIENAQIRSFSTGNFIYGSSEVDFYARLENKGNVLVRPIGPLEIHNMFGSKVASLIFNDSQAGVFPQSMREFEITWEDDGPGFGRYEAILSLVYGVEGRQSTISSTVSFWILPMNIIAPAAAVLAVLLLSAYIGVRLYIRNTLRAVTGGRTRRVVQRQKRSGVSVIVLVLVVMLVITSLFLIILLALFA